jgi:tetratricopeptide (TPR) repeat protein
VSYYAGMSSTDSYFDLGSYTRTVSTDSPDAQMWFDRGLNWLYAFHKEEAERCFVQAIEADPRCAMAHWGLVYAIGPYYNGPWIRLGEPQRAETLARAYRLARDAAELAIRATDVERALIVALAARFGAEQNESQDVFDSWDDDYAAAMRRVHAEFPNDLDVTALTVESLMVRTPWRLWDLDAGVPAEGASTAEAIQLLEECFAANDTSVTHRHPGLLHFWIHIMEMSPSPERALDIAVVLQTLCPDAAHLVHMASHIQILCGQYEEALMANVEAVIADDKYVAHNPTLGVYTAYRMHNIHFQIYAAMFLGNFEKAMAAADLIRQTVTADVLRHDNAFLVRYLEAFYGMKLHVLIRFGRWNDIINMSLPDEVDLFVSTTALCHYAKGVAYAATGDVEQAERQQQLFAEAWERVPEDHFVFNNQTRDVLKIGEAMLAGEVEYRKGNFDAAFAHLAHSVDIDDHLYYNEPWVWMQPPRHALGALLLEQGRVEEAAGVYRADLGIDDTLVRSSQHPGNVWALHGYAECLDALGRLEEAADIRAELVVAKKSMDVELTSSCFCRGAS